MCGTFPPTRVGCHRGEHNIRATRASLPTSPGASSDRVQSPKSLYMMITKHNHAHRPWGRPWSRSLWLGAALWCFLGRRPRGLADSDSWTDVLDNGLPTWQGSSSMYTETHCSSDKLLFNFVQLHAAKCRARGVRSKSANLTNGHRTVCTVASTSKFCPWGLARWVCLGYTWEILNIW